MGLDAEQPEISAAVKTPMLSEYKSWQSYERNEIPQHLWWFFIYCSATLLLHKLDTDFIEEELSGEELIALVDDRNLWLEPAPEELAFFDESFDDRVRRRLKRLIREFSGKRSDRAASPGLNDFNL
jgi:hypothetical protein